MNEPQREVKEWAQTILDQHALFTDTETTGLYQPNHHIIELAIYNPEIGLCMNTLVRPDPPCEIESNAFNAHHITQEMLLRAPTGAMIEPIVHALFLDKDLVIFNAGFDLPFLLEDFHLEIMEPGSSLLMRYPFNVHCLMLYYAAYYGEPHWEGGFKWQSLKSACQQCGIKQVMPHTALGDAMAAYELTRYLANVRE